MKNNIGNLFINILNHPEIIFATIALFFGIRFLFLTPPGCVPDEPSHIYKSCEVANGIFYSKEPVKQTIYDKKLESIVPKRDSNNFHFASRYSPTMYLSSALGIKVSNYFSNDSKLIFYSGRFCNLLMYIILITIAIKITPVFKYPFLFSGLLPMALFEGMSYSADSFNTAFAFLFFAYLFKLIFSKKDLTNKEFFFLSFFSIIGAFCKGLIYPIFLYFFIPFKKNKFPYIISLIILTIFICYYWININPENINPLHKVIDSPLYIFQHPIDFIKISYYTTITDFYIYIKGLIGILGWLSITLPEDTYIMTIIVFVSMLIILNEKIKFSIKISSLLIFLIFYLSFLYIHLIYWTPINANIITGIQGRYFLSLLPLIFLFLSTNKIKFSEKYKYYFKAFIILFIIYLLNTTCNILHMYYHELGINVVM